MKLKNTLFASESKRSDVSKYNACVGNNGWVGMYSYIDGFQSSTVILLESLIKEVDKENFDGFTWCIDTSVYPILFSARHFLELFLKQQILRISYFKNKSESDYEIKLKLLKTHDTHKLWQLFLAEVKGVYDSRLNKYLNKIHTFTLEFHNVDSTGETFRYPYNQKNSLHLTNHSVIGLKRFYEEFLKFSKIAAEFSYLTDYLIQEYRVGTYTKHLSRNDIEQIAYSLPKKNYWTSQKLKKHQLYIKDKYGIGNKEFKEVLDIIQKNIEFNNIVSNEYNLNINEQNLIKFCLNCLIEPKQNLNLSLSDLAWIRAIQEISVPIINGKYFSEDVHYLRESYYKEYEKFNEYALEEEIDYVYQQLNRTIKGLEKLRQFNTLNKIHIVFKTLFVYLLKSHKDNPLDIESRPRSARHEFEDMFKDIIFN
jgi:hypothetical protein